jgi:tetratricopeptide (TPR) repeat protein
MADDFEAVPSDVAAWLAAQTELARLQIDALQAGKRRTVWGTVRRYLTDAQRFVLEGSVVVIAVLLVLGLTAMAITAGRQHKLVIESFAVPDDLARRGLSGPVVASQLLDKLQALQGATVSARAAESYANDWSGGIKIQIPDTGVSTEEFYRYLVGWLGHETHITGEIYEAANDYAASARIAGGGRVAAHDAEVDALLQATAERIYAQTQPYRYAVYLDSHEQAAGATAIFQQLIDSGSAADRAWAYNGLANQVATSGDFAAASDLMRRAIRAEPGLIVSYDNLAGFQDVLKHDEEVIRTLRQALTLAARRPDGTIDSGYFDSYALSERITLAFALGDSRAALELEKYSEAQADLQGSVEEARDGQLFACGELHDGRCLHDIWTSLPPIPDTSEDVSGRLGNMLFANARLARWTETIATGERLKPLYAKRGGQSLVFEALEVEPLEALAHAHLGDWQRAHAEIDATPADCVLCLRVHGLIDALEGNRAGAAWWFRRAVAAAPSSPFADTDWGEMLLRKGDLAGAIAEFTSANRKGPRFADPLELWGEALIAANRSDLAIAKFAEAARYAPSWGRLHLKWGEALLYLGRAGEAQAQFAAARTMDLSRADRARLPG